MVVALADFIVLTIDYLPFTRPYRPGHAKLKTRWPLYVLGAFSFSDGLARLELLAWHDVLASVILLMGTVLVVMVFEWTVRRSGYGRRTDVDDELDDNGPSVTLLNLGRALRMQEKPVS